MAYADVIGVPAVYGLYVLLLPLLVYAAVGWSRRVIIGPEAGTSAMLGAAFVGLDGGDPLRRVQLASATALLVAACFLIARLIRLGWIADYFSRAVLVGYLHGIVIVLIASQLGKLTGVSITDRDPIPQVVTYLHHIADTHVGTLAIGVTTLVLIFVVRRLSPKLPAAPIIVVLSIAISWLFDLASHGVAIVGPIPSGLPSIRVPDVAASDLLRLLPVAFGVFLVSFADGILTARSFYADVSFHPSAVVTPGVVVYRLEDRWFFANAGYVTGRINEAIAGTLTPTQWLVIDAERMPDIDASAVESFEVDQTPAS